MVGRILGAVSTGVKAINLMAPTSTSAALVELVKEIREYVCNICGRFIADYLMQLDNFQAKGKPGRIRLGEVVLIHDEDTKRLMWSTGLVTELRPSRDGLIHSAVLKTPSGNHINRAIQCLYLLEVRQDNHEDVVVEEELGSELAANPTPPNPAPSDPDPVVGEVEPDSTGSGGEYVWNILTPQQPTVDLEEGA